MVLSPDREVADVRADGLGSRGQAAVEVHPCGAPGTGGWNPVPPTRPEVAGYGLEMGRI